MDESAEEDLRATKRTATIGSSGDVEGSTLQTVVPRKMTEGECSTVDVKSVKKVEANAGKATTIAIIEYSKDKQSYQEVLVSFIGDYILDSLACNQFVEIQFTVFPVCGFMTTTLK